MGDILYLKGDVYVVQVTIHVPPPTSLICYLKVHVEAAIAI